MGKADWNYFSNYVYGVPGPYCKKNSAISGKEKHKIINPAVTIGQFKYIEVEVEEVEVVSAYQSNDEKLVNNYKVFTPLWQKVFGTHPPVEGYDQSFITTRMKMKFFIRFDKGYDSDLKAEAYNTYVYGGSINMDFPDKEYNEDFLRSQLAGLKQSMRAEPFRKSSKQ